MRAVGILAAVSACSFERGVAPTQDVIEVPTDVAPPDDDMPITPDAPPDAPSNACTTSGLVCAGATTAVTCDSACWVTCTAAAGLTQAVAANACTNWGGKLAPIRDAADQTCVAGFFPQATNWIGYVQVMNASDVDVGWSFNADGVSAASPNWDTGEPNDANYAENNQENCAYMLTNGRWNDTPCTETFTRFSCRR